MRETCLASVQLGAHEKNAIGMDRSLVLVREGLEPSTSAWTPQQLRKIMGFQIRYQYLLHDRDRIFAEHLDESSKKLDVSVLKSPPRAPTANSICERVIGTIRRECLDWLIPLSESHLRLIPKSWIVHYNAGVRTCHFAQAFPIRPPYSMGDQRSVHGIDVTNRLPSAPSQSLGACITNTPSHPMRRDGIFADHTL